MQDKKAVCGRYEEKSYWFMIGYYRNYSISILVLVCIIEEYMNTHILMNMVKGTLLNCLNI
jgi:hypothetical protein